MSDMFSTKIGATRLLICIVVGLIILKVTVSWFTGSISIIAQATDSLLDLMAGIITFSAIRMASKPADEEHPYGHGKIESIAGIAQGTLIFVAGVIIIYSSVQRIINHTGIQRVDSGIGVMIVSIVISILLSRHLSRVARETDSTALEANARNIAADVYSALAVLVGLVIVRLTNLIIIDSAIAIGVALYILKIAIDTTRKSVSELIDSKLPPAKEEAIKNCLLNYTENIVGFHKLRTRKSGSQHYVDMHLVMAKETSVEQAHQICDDIESEMCTLFNDASITIHIEPCNGECAQCTIVCSSRKTENET
jgi:cation diffusion facilitator family transporter